MAGCVTRYVRYISTLIQGVLMRYARHHSACMHTDRARPETNRTHSSYPNPAPISQEWPYLDVEPYTERPLATLQIDAERAVAARRPVHDFAIFDLLGDGAHQRTHASHSEARNTIGSKLPVTGHDIRPREHSQGCAWWLTAHGVRKSWQRHDMTLPAAPTHVWDLTRMDTCDRCACS